MEVNDQSDNANDRYRPSKQDLKYLCYNRTCE